MKDRKKPIALLLSVFLLLSLAAAPAAAENGDGQDTTPGETTTTGEPVGPTGPTDPTGPTGPAAEPRFTFVNHGGVSLTVSWNAGELPGVTASAVIDGTVRGGPDDTGEFTVPLGELAADEELYPGVYSMSYQLSDGRTVSEPNPVYVAGELDTSMSVAVENNRIVATVRDERGRAVEGLSVRLLFDRTQQGGAQTTGADGRAVFPISPPSDLNTVLCIVDNQTLHGYIQYVGCSGSPTGTVVTPATTTTTSQATTTTTTQGNSTTPSPSTDNNTTPQATTTASTEPTYEMIAGAGTTAVVGGQIAVNTSFDTKVASDFGCSAADFAAAARLLIDRDLYTALVGQSGSVLMMEAKTSSFAVTDQHISQAISGLSAYSSYHPEETLRIPLDLSLHLVNSAQGVDTAVPMPGGEVTVQLPVPASMSSGDQYRIAVAFLDENGITRLADTTVEDGILSFKTTGFSSVAVLGFKTEGGSSVTGGMPTISIILIVVGVLMLAGAGTLLYFFFLRKPAPEGPDGPDGEGEGGEEGGEGGNGYRPGPPSGTTPGGGTAEDEAAWKQAEESEQGGLPTPPETGVSLGSLMNHPSSGEAPATRKKNPSDYDLDL
ncbi:MAG TPA: hypothetical protein H9684_05720 [Firmicutes bacterium]|nr:hypothetical protein [Bacillota bacterium]